MHFAIARAILATPRKASIQHAIVDHDSLIWAEHGEEVNQWNAIAAAQGWGQITVRDTEAPDGEQFFFYTYKGEEKQCPYEWNREDNLRSVLSIAELVKADAHLYACNDHAGNSEQGFLAMRPEQWRALATEFGADAVAFRFTRAEGSYDEFAEVYFRDENMHPDGVPEPEPAEVPFIELMDQLRAVGERAGCSFFAYYHLLLGTRLHILIVSDTAQASRSLFENRGVGAQLTDMCQQLCRRSNCELQCIAFLSQEELAADVEGKLTIGWMDAGTCRQLRFEVTPDHFNDSDGEPQDAVAGTATWHERVKALARKHWLTISFFAVMLSLLIFGKGTHPPGG